MLSYGKTAADDSDHSSMCVYFGFYYQNTSPERLPDQLDVKEYGVIVTRELRQGLLLPNLEGIDTVEKQIAIAKQKAGLNRGRMQN